MLRARQHAGGHREPPGLREPDHKCPARSWPGTRTGQESVGEPAEPPPPAPRTDTCSSPLWGARGGRGDNWGPQTCHSSDRGKTETEQRPGGSRCSKGISQLPPSSGGALCPPTPPHAASVALGDTEAGRGGPQCPSCVGTVSPAGGRAPGGTRFPPAAGGNGAGRARPGPRSAGTWPKAPGAAAGGGTQGVPGSSLTAKVTSGGHPKATLPVVVPTGLCPLSVTATHRRKSSLYWRALTRYNSPGGQGWDPPRVGPPSLGSAGLPRCSPRGRKAPFPRAASGGSSRLSLGVVSVHQRRPGEGGQGGQIRTPGANPKPPNLLPAAPRAGGMKPLAINK